MKIDTVNKLFSELGWEVITKYSLLSSNLVTSYTYWQIQLLKYESAKKEKEYEEKYYAARDEYDNFLDEIYRLNEKKLSKVKLEEVETIKVSEEFIPSDS